MTATEKTTTVFIKNMVCDRCIMAVHKTIEEMGLKPIDVKLGSATVEGAIDDNQRQGLRKKLQSIGFELLDDLSKLFSEYASKTIERYYMEMRIERVKELLTYGELTLSQIALKLNYSSTAYLSSQFKAVTGMTPSQFKKLQGDKRRKLDEI